MMELIAYGTLSFVLAGLYRQLALRYRWLDHPNQRSSHTAITPRGAGVIFALLIVGVAAWTLRADPLLLCPIATGVIVALTGWWDDLRGVGAGPRFALYIASACIAVIPIARLDTSLPANLATAVLWGLIAAVALTWLINLYNFMDGINGIAALEALFVLLGICWLAQGSTYAVLLAKVHLLSSAAIAGFLLWNFPAGKLFMGDAGSAFLGFFLGTLAMLSSALQGPILTVWLILLAVFIADTGYTLAVRLATRQKWYEAHRLHAYQRLTSLMRGSHPRTTGIIMVINLCWLLPLAWLVHNKMVDSLFALALAYAPLLLACRALKAGIPRSGAL